MLAQSLAMTGLICCGGALFGATSQLACVRALPRPEFGLRGLQRAQALERAGSAVFESALRWLAAIAHQLPADTARRRIVCLIERAGYPLGLCEDECLALCAVAAVLACAVTTSFDLAPAARALSSCAGALAPLAQLREIAAARQREIARRLPSAIDLLALCMGAGLDFQAALALLTNERTFGDGALDFELQRLLHELKLGRTRTRVLTEFGERIPSAAVRDFVHAVIQAEQRGTPLAQVLQVQARVLRMRRSVRAEEAAARASVLLVLPLLLLLGAVLLLLFGPFLVNGIGL